MVKTRMKTEYMAVALAVITAGFWLIPAIVYQPYGLINHDTYQYVALANAYIQNPGDVFSRDAYTVGPVIPGTIALVKIILGTLYDATISTDVAIVKTFSAIMYLVGFGALLVASRSHRSIAAAVITATFLFAFLPRTMDTLSLNGELVCATLLLLVMALLSPGAGKKTVAIAAVLSMLVVYTKLQALPILGVILIFSLQDLPQDRRRLFWFLLALMLGAAELVFVLHGGGWTRHVTDLLDYSRLGGKPVDVNGPGLAFPVRLIGRILRYSYWAVFTLVQVFPLVLAAAYIWLRFDDDKKTRLNFFVVAMFFATLFSILFSGYLFQHYIILGLPLLAVLLRVVNAHEPRVAAFTRSPFPIGVGVLLLLSNFSDVAFEPGLPQGFRLRPVPTWPGEKTLQNLTKSVGPLEGDVLVHGWDYSWYSALGKHSPTAELSLVSIGRITPQNYADFVLSKEFPYIVDVTDFSGLLRGSDFRLDQKNIYSELISPAYELAWSGNGLRLYRRRHNAHSTVRSYSPRSP